MPTDFTLKAATAASKTERDAWLEAETMRRERDDALAQLAEHNRATTRIMCAGCGAMVRTRETADGRCAACLRRERDAAAAVAVALRLWNYPGDDRDAVDYVRGLMTTRGPADARRLGSLVFGPETPTETK